MSISSCIPYIINGNFPSIQMLKTQTWVPVNLRHPLYNPLYLPHFPQQTNTHGLHHLLCPIVVATSFVNATNDLV